MANYVWNNRTDNTTLLTRLSLALTFVVLPQTTSPDKRLEVGIWMGNFLYYNMHRNDTGRVIDVKSSLSDALKSIRSFVMTNDQWADKLDGSFRSTSPVYKLTETQFVDTVFEEVGHVNSEELWRECEIMRRTANASLRLIGDYHPVFYTCWECDRAFEKILKCGKCMAALYCSSKCQVAAWKGGHKKKCGRLKMMHKSFLASVEEVERMHVTGMHDGLELSPQTDCIVMQLCLRYEGRSGIPNKERILCSMKSFYENLGRIHRGEWWIFNLSNQEKNDADSDARDRTHPDIVMALQSLAVDWFAEARCTLGTAFVDPQLVTALTEPFFRTKCSAPFTADTLLEIYRTADPTKQFRPHFKLYAFESLRELHDDELEKLMDACPRG